MDKVKFYCFDAADNLYLGEATVSRYENGRLKEITYCRVVNTETEEEVFPDTALHAHLLNLTDQAVVDAMMYPGIEERAEQYHAEYEAAEKGFDFHSHLVNLTPDRAEMITVQVKRATRQVVLWRKTAVEHDFHPANTLPPSLLQYLNWHAAGCPAEVSALVEA